MLHWSALYHGGSAGSEGALSDVDGRGHAAARWTLQAHGSRDAKGQGGSQRFLQCRDARKPRRIVGSEPGWEPARNGIAWSLVDFASRLLERGDREAVLGDLVEAGEGVWQVLFNVLGLVFRRQAALWKNWRPWLAAFGLALPGTLLLMGYSVSVSRAYQQVLAPAILKTTGLTVGPGFWLFVSNILLLIGWSWTGGFVMGSVSRRTIWVSAVLSFWPCVFCFSRFRIESLSRFCLFVFLLPAIWGVLRGLRVPRVQLSSAVILAVGVTALTIPTWTSSGPWIPNWALSWPAWYLVATARRPGERANQRSEPNGE